MRLIDADALIAEANKDGAYGYVDAKQIADAPTVCCETCKYGIKGERVGDYEYFTCVKPYAEMSNNHIKDWVCGDYRDKNEVN